MKKVISLILTVLMLFTVLPMSTFAEEVNAPKISVESTDAIPGETFDVNVRINNNPGLVMSELKVEFGSALTLIAAESKDAMPDSIFSFTPPGKLANGGVITGAANFTWYVNTISDSNIRNGVMLKLTFTLSDTAQEGEVYDIKVSSTDGLGDRDLNLYSASTSGRVTVVNYTPGDVNDDKRITMLDVVLLSRYIADGGKTDPDGYNVSINKKAGNVNDDGRINMLDVVLISRYIADGCLTDPEGYNIKLIPESIACTHNLQKYEANEATCTKDGNDAYWYCSKCHSYFSDENGTVKIDLSDTVIDALGHDPIVIPDVPATPDSAGSQGGTKCSRCGITLIEPTPIPPIEVNEYQVIYDVIGNMKSDDYLKAQSIENPKQVKFTSEAGIERLEGLEIAGYTFDYWCDDDGNKVVKIPKGTEENVYLSAHWTLNTYQIQFDSPDVPMESVTYSVNTGKTLTNAEWYGYTFVGWSNDDGFIVNRIKPGTTGNITLHANWTSNRNKAVSFDKYNDPIIIEDNINGSFLFVYDIGRIDNVPLAQIEYIGNTQKIEIDKEYSVTNSISEDTANTVANMVSNATTRSSAWTLSKEWNDIYEEGSEYANQLTKTEERTDSEGNTVGGNYFVSNSEGGSSYMSSESGGSSSNSSKVTTDKSFGINKSYDNTDTVYVDGKLGVKNETELSAGVEVPVKIAKVSAGVKNTTTVSAEVAAGRKNTTSVHADSSASYYVGTVDTKDSNSYYNVSASNSSTWNSTSGFEKSYQTTRNTAVTNAVAEQVSQKTNYNVSKAVGGSDSATESVGGTDTRSDEYSTTLKYSKGDATTKSQSIKYSSDRPGYYRLVNAGTIHVFGVVGYDVATDSYFTYSYNVLDDERHAYLDYSKDNALFNDCENGLVDFEIPYEVNEYIMGVTGRTDGLGFNTETGEVYKFTEKEGFNGVVTIPQYYSANNGDGSYSAVDVTSFTASAFAGNTNIETVILPLHVTKIPDGAFEGCTNLKKVIAYGVTEIGANAFKGCTSLESFSIDNVITFLGDNAFEGVTELSVMANNPDVAKAAINSGAKRITLNLASMSGSFDNETINITEDTDYFFLISNGATYKNLKLVSAAKEETAISNMKLTENRDTPLEISSPTVSLLRLTVETAPGFALVLKNDNTEVNLFGTVSLGSKGDNAVIAKNITLQESNPEAMGKIEAFGDVLVCGTVTNDSLLKVNDNNNNTYDTITAQQYENYLKSCTVTFDANGGSAVEESKVVVYGQKFGTLPPTTLDNYTFDGWYTSAEGGTKITSDSTVDTLADITLYAHWTPNQFSLNFNANGGSVETESKTLTFGDSFGELPTPTRDYYNFIGWFTEAEDGEQVFESTTPTTASDITVYAHWTDKELVGWVLASEMPEDAQVVNRKYTYTQRFYSTSGSSTMSGWTKYDTKRTSWGGTQGPVYSDPSNGARNVWSEQYETSSKSHYNYYHVHKDNGYVSPAYTQAEYDAGKVHFITIDYELAYKGDSSLDGKPYYGYYDAGSCKDIWYKNGTYITKTYTYGTRWYYQEPVYTYYFYKDENKESSTEPTGENISNVLEWVQYRPKTTYSADYTLENTVTYNGHTYSLYSSDASVSWNAAKIFCEKNGGNLAVITSAEENTAVANLVGENAAWIGASRTETTDWCWVNDESFSYTAWADNQPDNAGNREFYAGFFSISPGKWNDFPVYSSSVSKFVMES